MPNRLTILSEQEVRRYLELGYHCPVRALGDGEAAEFRSSFEQYFAHHSGRLRSLLPRQQTDVFLQTHASLRWVYRLDARPKVLGAVEGILGPDILIWGSRWFPKQAHDKSYVARHQGATRWGLDLPNLVTAWIALTENARENGCLRIVPGTHLGPMLPQRETDDPDNALSRGQEIAVEVD